MPEIIDATFSRTRLTSSPAPTPACGTAARIVDRRKCARRADTIAWPTHYRRAPGMSPRCPRTAITSQRSPPAATY